MCNKTHSTLKQSSATFMIFIIFDPTLISCTFLTLTSSKTNTFKQNNDESVMAEVEKYRSFLLSVSDLRLKLLIKI